MDFDDLLVNGRRLLQECPLVLQDYQERFLYALVDEYQDTNPIQASLVDLLSARHRNLLVVGDDFQSIYSWRGADYRHFLSFPERYPDAHVFKLETNYRSLPGILNVANECIAGNPNQFQKTLRAVRTAPDRPRLVDVQDGRQQAHYVAEEIARWVGAGVQPREIAVLYRSHFHALEAQLELQRRGIPFAITSGVRFFEQAHIKDVCAVLRLAHAPADALAFRRLLPLLPRIGERGAARIWRDLGERFNPLSRAENQALLLRLPEPARAAWTRTAAALATVPAEPPGDRAGRLIEKFIESFYDEYIALNFEDADRRREDLQALMDYTARYDTLGDFLNEVALLTNVDTGGAARRRRTDGEDRVLLSTVHQAKGLEWRVVFVLWLAEGLFRPVVRWRRIRRRKRSGDCSMSRSRAPRTPCISAPRKCDWGATIK